MTIKVKLTRITVPSVKVVMAVFTITAILIATHLAAAAGQEIGVGVCYGQLGDNLPSPLNVVALYKQHNLNKMRIFQPDPAVLDALRGSGIQVIVGTYNKDIAVLAQSVDAAQAWFGAHIQPYIGSVSITHISVGNEVYPSQPTAEIAPAMKNLQSVIDAAGLHGVVKVTTVVSMQVLEGTYPPSASTFADPSMADIVNFLQSQGIELMVNVYPFYPYIANPAEVRLDYAQFKASEVVLQDGNLGYTNMFDAMVDSFYWAMEKVGAGNVGLVVAESGWPHGGDDKVATVELASTYTTKLVQHLRSGAGTPKRPNVLLQGYIFAMFDENQKPTGFEQFWGVFTPSGQLNYNPF